MRNKFFAALIFVCALFIKSQTDSRSHFMELSLDNVTKAHEVTAWCYLQREIEASVMQVIKTARANNIEKVEHNVQPLEIINYG